MLHLRAVNGLETAERIALIAEGSAVRARREERARRRVVVRRTSVVDHLAHTGRLRREEVQAADEILRVWTALTAQLFARAGSYGAGCRGRVAEDWPASLRRAYRERYCPWREEVGAESVRGRTTLADLVFFVAVDNAGVRQVGQRLGMDQRSVVRLLAVGLWRYVEIAGWAEVQKPVQRGLALATFQG
ncbi:MAG: hypothetical protein KGH75_00825 [Rhodospirillales bacterium]|nr:hypothetical protein [Rhodospirillales bacterium]